MSAPIYDIVLREERNGELRMENGNRFQYNMQK